MSDPSTFERDSHSAYQRAEQVKRRYQAEILTKANVVGVGVGLRSRAGKFTEEVAIVVMVSRKLPSADLADEDLLPQEIEGIPVDVQEVGEFSVRVD
jgi:hypothetical protein